jgi:hypothetical protein
MPFSLHLYYRKMLPYLHRYCFITYGTRNNSARERQNHFIGIRIIFHKFKKTLHIPGPKLASENYQISILSETLLWYRTSLVLGRNCYGYPATFKEPIDVLPKVMGQNFHHLSVCTYYFFAPSLILFGLSHLTD